MVERERRDRRRSLSRLTILDLRLSIFHERFWVFDPFEIARIEESFEMIEDYPD